MSGGSFDYLYWKVEDMGRQLKQKDNTTLQRAFGNHLIKVAKAMHDIEWVFSGDYGKGDDDEAIKEVLNDKDTTFDVLRKDALELIEELKKYTI